MPPTDTEESKPFRSIWELSPMLIPYILGFFMYLGIFSTFPIYIQLKENLTDIETVNLWAIISGFALLIGAATRIPAGILSDRIGRVKAIFVSYTVYILALVLIIVFPNNILYIIAVGIIRFGTNIVAMTGRGLVSRSRRDLGLKNGMLFSISGFGSFLGPTLLGYVLDHFRPEMILFASLAIIVIDIFLFVLTYGAVEDWLKRSGEISDLDYGPLEYLPKIRPMTTLRKPGVIRIQLFFLLTGLLYSLVLSIYSIYGFNIMLLSASVIGLVTGLGSLSQTFSSPIIGWLYNHVKDEYMRLLMWFLLFLGSAAAIMSQYSVIAYIACFFFLNIGFSGNFTMEITNMRQLIEPEEFSFTFGLASTFVLLATAFAGFMSPILYAISPNANFYLSFALAAVSFLYILVTTPRELRKRNEREIDDGDDYFNVTL